MAIGTTAAILGAAVIGAAGSALGGRAQSHAAEQANESQQAAMQAQLQLGRETNALNANIYNANTQLLNPFVQRGNVAGDSINALLGLPSYASSPAAAPAGVPTSPAPAPTGAAPQSGPMSLGQFVESRRGAIPAGDIGRNPGQAGQGMVNGHGVQGAPYAGMTGGTPIAGAPMGATATARPATAPTSGAPTVNALTASDAMHNFANSAGMQFQLEQGSNALNHLYAANGSIQSGAAMKAMQNYGQQTALNNYFLPYMGLLGGQQAVGAQAGSAVAGVGSDYGRTIAANNANMGNTIQQGANSASNSAIARGNATAGMWSGIGAAAGGAAGMLSRSSYGNQLGAYPSYGAMGM